MDFIRDGKGKGYLAGVTNENMLATRAVNISHLFHHAVYHANNFVISTEHVFASGGTEEIICNFEYLGNANVILSRVDICSNSSGLAELYFYAGSEDLSGGTVITPSNTNTGSRNSIETNITGTDEGVSAITAGALGTKIWEVFLGYHSNTYVSIDTYNAFIIKPNTHITFVGESASAGDKMSINLVFFEEEDRF